MMILQRVVKMKLKQKLAIGLVFVSLLVGVVGFIGLYANDQVVKSFETGNEHFGSIITASNEVSSYAKRAEGHIMLFLTLHNETDEQKFFNRTASLREQISIIDNDITNPEARRILNEIVSETNELQSIGESLLEEYDNETSTTGRFDPENHEASIRRLDDTAAKIRTSGLDLAKLELRLQKSQEDAAKSNAAYLYNIVFVISAVAVMSAVASVYIIARNIYNPLLKLKKAATEISRGNLSSRIRIESKDEIGELAKTFDRMRIQLKQKEVIAAKDRNELLNSLLKTFEGKFGNIATIVMRQNLQALAKKNPRIIKMIPQSIRKTLDGKRNAGNNRSNAHAG